VEAVGLAPAEDWWRLGAGVVGGWVDVLRRSLAGVLVVLHVPAAPVNAPLPGLDGVAEARAREPCPVALPVPWWSRLDDRDVPVADLGFYPHLIPQVLGHAFTAPAADAHQIGLGHRHTCILLSELPGSLEAVEGTQQP